MANRTLLLTACLLLIGGCAGSGRVELAALDFRTIDPPAGPPPRFVRLSMDRCYWWTDDEGRVWIAMQRDKPSPLGSLGHFRFQMSLVLEDLPAGRARNYLVKKREFRGVARMGPAHSRWTSLSGVVALYREPGDRLRGSFRLQVAREVQQLLGGWSPPNRYLLMGTFVARPDANGHGRQITEMIGASVSSSSRQAQPARDSASTTPVENTR